MRIVRALPRIGERILYLIYRIFRPAPNKNPTGIHLRRRQRQRTADFASKSHRGHGVRRTFWY